MKRTQRLGQNWTSQLSTLTHVFLRNSAYQFSPRVQTFVRINSRIRIKLKIPSLSTRQNTKQPQDQCSREATMCTHRVAIRLQQPHRRRDNVIQRGKSGGTCRHLALGTYHGVARVRGLARDRQTNYAGANCVIAVTAKYYVYYAPREASYHVGGQVQRVLCYIPLCVEGMSLVRDWCGNTGVINMCYSGNLSSFKIHRQDSDLQ